MPMHDEGNFPDIPHESCPTSAGEVGVPILYAHTTCVLALFRVDHGPAQAAVQDLGLDAVRLPGARAFAVLTFAVYGDSTIGPYGESGLALATVAAGTDAGFPSILSLWRSNTGPSGVGYAVLHLPVTTGLACAAGREIGGYPKFVTAVHAAIHRRHVSGDVRDPDTGASLVHLEGRTGLAMPSPALDVLLVPRLGGATLAAAVEARGMGRLRTPGTVRLAPLGSSHPTARTLARLGMDGARPAAVFRALSPAGPGVLRARPRRAAGARPWRRYRKPGRGSVPAAPRPGRAQGGGRR